MKQALKDGLVKELGGWRTLAMVQRYAHLAPAHLHAAVERLVASAVEEVTAQVIRPGRRSGRCIVSA